MSAAAGPSDLEQLRALEKDMWLDLDRIERQIAEEEDKYVAASAAAAGNILIGYDFLDGQRKDRKARLFSESSQTWTYPRKAEEGRKQGQL